MNEYVFDHDRLDVYRLSIETTSDALMALKFENISEPKTAYANSSSEDYEHEHEHEHRLWLSTDRK